MQEAETDGRGATEFGRASERAGEPRQRSPGKLPLPAAASQCARARGGHVTREALAP